jgi:hypothetical protein
MNALGTAEVSQATLAQVAPASPSADRHRAGAFAAIPAVVAYNRYTHDVDRWRRASRRSSRNSPTSCSGRADAMRRPRKSINQTTSFRISK